MPQNKRIIVIGGGAAGFMAAITATQHNPSAQVTLLEKNRSVLNKVRISGGGRCNVTNGAASVVELLRGYPRGAKFLRPLFDIYNNQHTQQWFESKGVALKTEPDGRVFPKTDDSETIIDCLLDEVQRLGISIETSMGVAKLMRSDTEWQLQTRYDDTFVADAVIITTGGNPQLDGYNWLADLGVNVLPPVPSLFTFNVPDSPFHDLSGVAVPEASVRIAGTKLTEKGPVLFTHWGLSGPAILRLSAWGARELHDRQYAATALINFTNFASDDAARTALVQYRTNAQWRGKLVASHAPVNIPQRLWKLLVSMAQITEATRWSDIPQKNLNRLVELLVNCPFAVSGKTTFKDEFVTCGGVSLGQLNGKTLEHKNLNGLYFAGEVIDIDGITGGYNFQSAWTTGYLAGLHAAI